MSKRNCWKLSRHFELGDLVELVMGGGMEHNRKEHVISIGMVIWNSEKDLQKCLAGLACQEEPFELIVVDNGSTDSSLLMLNGVYPDAIVLRNSENVGFCKAHNQAIRASIGEYYLALNPDVHLTKGYLRSLVSVLEHDCSVGTACGKLILNDGSELKRIDTTGLFIDRKRRQYLRGHGEVDSGQYDYSAEVFGADGAAPLYRREMLENVKIDGQYFDEAFVSHKEDVDLAWRARLLGWRCTYTPEAVGYHRRSFRPGKRAGLSGEIRLDAVKNRYLLLMKNELCEGWKRDWLSIISYDWMILFYVLLFERSSLKAIGKVKKLIPRMKRWREEIMKRRKAKAEEIYSWIH